MTEQPSSLEELRRAGPPEAGKPGPSRKAIVGWGVGMFLVLGLAWFVGGVVVPVRRTADVLRERDAARSITREQTAAFLDRLGGPGPARKRLELYLRLPPGVARHRRQAVLLLRDCGLSAHSPREQMEQAPIVLTSGERRELAALWEKMNKLPPREYEQTVLPAWKKYGDKAFLFALERLKGDNLYTWRKDPCRIDVHLRTRDIPNRTHRPVMQLLKAEIDSPYYIAAVMAFFPLPLTYEQCRVLMEFSDDKRVADPGHPRAMGPPYRLCDYAVYGVVNDLGLNEEYSQYDVQGDYEEKDREIQAFKRWWEANRAVVEKKLGELGPGIRYVPDGMFKGLPPGTDAEKPER